MLENENNTSEFFWVRLNWVDKIIMNWISGSEKKIHHSKAVLILKSLIIDNFSRFFQKSKKKFNVNFYFFPDNKAEKHKNIDPFVVFTEKKSLQSYLANISPCCRKKKKKEWHSEKIDLNNQQNSLLKMQTD